MTFDNLQEALDYFTGFQARLITHQQEQEALVKRYKDETRAFFGVEDGQPLNIIQMAALFARVSERYDAGKPPPRPSGRGQPDGGNSGGTPGDARGAVKTIRRRSLPGNEPGQEGSPPLDAG